MDKEILQESFQEVIDAVINTSVNSKKIEELEERVQSLENELVKVLKTLQEGDFPQEDIVEEPVEQEKVYETVVKWGVNFRSEPSTDEGVYVYRMIPKGEYIHVVREVDAEWLEVEVQDGTVGYISAKPKFTDYSSKSLSEKQADQIIAFGEKYLGHKYDFGAKMGDLDSDGKQMFDCSLFTQYVFKEVLDIKLPRVSYNQAKEGTEVNKEDIKKGDLLFFSVSSRGLDIGHVGIYAGDNKILQTYSNKSGGVRYSNFLGTQWESRFTTARRLL